MRTSNPSLPRLSARQRQRSAGATLAGYLYQFERSVVEILDLGSGGEARIEGIEDIDLWGDSPKIIQVKYHETQKWSLKAVRSAIYEMLESFSSGTRVTYILYVHSKNGVSAPEKITVEDLKECLTYKPRGMPVQLLYEAFNEQDQAEFIASFEIRSGVSLEEQQRITASKISDALGCSLEEAELLHRMRAVQFLHEVATYEDESRRVVTKAGLLSVLNVREVLYYRWHKEVIGKELFLDAAVRRLKHLNFNTSNSYRGILVEVTPENIVAVGDLALELAKDMNGATRKRTTSAKPWTLILRSDDDCVMDVKRKLIESKVLFNDGYEHIHLSSEIFINPPLINSSGGSGRLIRASYSVRVISEEAMRKIQDQDHRLAQLLISFQPDAWHAQITRSEPTVVSGLSVEELTTVLRRVTT